VTKSTPRWKADFEAAIENLVRAAPALKQEIVRFVLTDAWLLSSSRLNAIGPVSPKPTKSWLCSQ
jgi:hypothetical protein